MSVSSQIDTSPSWRTIFSNRSAGLTAYSLVWRVEATQPIEARLLVARVAATESASTLPNAVRMVPLASGSRITTLPVQRGIEQVVPVARRLLVADRGRVVDQERHRAVEPEVEIVGIAARRRHRSRPNSGGRPAKQAVGGALHRRSCPARRTRRRPAGWRPPNGCGRRPPASPCRASARRPSD